MDYMNAYCVPVAQQVAHLFGGIQRTLPEGIGSFKPLSRDQCVAISKAKHFSQVVGTSSKQEIFSKLATSISSDLKKAATMPSPGESSDYVAALLNILEDKNLHGNILVDQALGGTPFSILTDMAEDLYRKANRMDIQTLPLFHVSQLYDIAHNPCIVFAQDQEVLQSRRPDSSALSQFYSGLYKIIGFKHTITTSNLSSSFALAKTQTRITT